MYLSNMTLACLSIVDVLKAESNIYLVRYMVESNIFSKQRNIKELSYDFTKNSTSTRLAYKKYHCKDKRDLQN